jgi:leader peptidase (prepilin peptidase)/N-methyltransferase
MDATVGLGAFAVVGGALAAAVNWAADVLPPKPSPTPVGEAKWCSPLPRVGEGGGNPSPGGSGSSGSLRADRRLLVAVAGLVGAPVAAHFFGPTWTALWLVGWGALFLLIAVIDFEHRLVLNRVLLAASVVALATTLLGVPGATRLPQALLGAALGFGLFVLIALLGRGAMGAGDVKLAGFIGLLVGYPAVLQALFAGIVFGGLAALAAILMGRGRKSTIPYAPWLALGAMVVLVQAA